MLRFFVFLKESFDKVSSIQIAGTACPDEMAIRSCMGCPVGLETIELERLEKWFFFSLMHCHFVIDVGQKNSGNYRLWSLMLQGMWVLPIVR